MLAPIALAAQTSHVLILDDDMLPGARYDGPLWLGLPHGARGVLSAALVHLAELYEDADKITTSRKRVLVSLS